VIKYGKENNAYNYSVEVVDRYGREMIDRINVMNLKGDWADLMMITKLRYSVLAMVFSGRCLGKRKLDR